MASVAIDTGVVVEYINLEGPHHSKARAVFSAAVEGKLEILLAHPVLTETYYVATRLYSHLGQRDPERRATRLVEWLFSLPSVRIPGNDTDLAVSASRVKITFGLALTDCYVLAAAKLFGGKALFRCPESEMRGEIEYLRREYAVLFLADYV